MPTPNGQQKVLLNIDNPTPAFNLHGFRWEPVAELNVGPQLTHRALAQQRVPGQQPFLAEAGKAQVDEQLSRPGGPGKTEPLKSPLAEFRGAYSGNGFTMIWVPSTFSKLDITGADGPNDSKLLLNLSTEQWTFGPPIGHIPNRGFGLDTDIVLAGLAYMQTVQDVNNEATGLPNKSVKAGDPPGPGMHFEPGVFLYVPGSQGNSPKGDSVVRMASIPHGTTINAQGPVGVNEQVKTERPKIDPIDTTPFNIGKPDSGRQTSLFKPQMEKADLTNKDRRQPQSLGNFLTKGTITPAIIKDPNTVLRHATEGLTIKEHTTFEVSTASPTAELKGGGGTANISFLSAGKGGPNADAVSMSSRFWIEKVEYELKLPKMAKGDERELSPTMPKSPHEAPTPRFAVTAGNAVDEGTVKKVIGTQIQYSQTVNLNFGGLTWPHVSVATLVPTDLQRVQV
jgi:hypothetical protein